MEKLDSSLCKDIKSHRIAVTAPALRGDSSLRTSLVAVLSIAYHIYENFVLIILQAKEAEMNYICLSVLHSL